MHLGVAQPEHPVVHPDLREAMAERTGLREFVLVVWEDEVEPAAVHLELGAEVQFAHRRALDVPARTAAAPRGVPPGVLTRLVRLPEREVARVLLARVRLLLLDFVGPLTGEPAVLRKARHAVVHVAVDLVGEFDVDQLLDHRDLFGHGFGCPRLEVRPTEAEAARVLEVPLGRVRASSALSPGAAS